MLRVSQKRAGSRGNLRTLAQLVPVDIKRRRVGPAVLRTKKSVAQGC